MFTITSEGKFKPRVKYKEPKKHGGKKIKREACLGGGDVCLEVSSVPQFPSPSNPTRSVPAVLSFSTIRLKREMSPELYSRIFSQ